MEIESRIFHFNTLDLFLEGRRRLLAVIQCHQECEGPDWVLAHKATITETCFEDYYKDVELPATEGWIDVEAKTGVTRLINERQGWKASGKADDLIHCLGGDIGIHPAAELFARKDILDGRCLPHYLYRQWGSIKAEAPIYYTKLKAYDRRRGSELTPEASTPPVSTSWQRLDQCTEVRTEAWHYGRQSSRRLSDAFRVCHPNGEGQN
jgi:hypothetical protein